MGSSDQKLYLGVDFSTQQGKIIVVNETLAVVYEDNVSYDKDLPEFGTEGGVNFHGDDKLSVTAPSAMFIKALDLMLDRMVERGFDFRRVVALSGDAQQCGSVYWKHGARSKLQNLETTQSMYDQLKDVFSIPEPPMWMDSTSTKQCRQLENAVGGPMELARITGSRAFEHDTGTEIMKIFQTQRDAYENTERITMISSQMASLFLGDYAPIDYGDGSMMGLLDIRTKHWDTKCLNACGVGLAEKLGEPHPSHELLGNVSSYLVKKYGFPADCKITPFTGDNLQSMIGLAVKKDELIVSMGTADCLFLWSSVPVPNLFGHVLVSALDPETFFSLLPFKNGSLTRQHMMERCAGSWEKFTEMFNSTPPGNNGNIGMYFDVTEIVPFVMGQYRFNKDDEVVESFSPEVEIRAVLEGQFLARRMYAEKCGLQLGPDTKIIATGGASANKTILQVIADIFNTPVYTINVPNSAALGGCYRAKLVVEGKSTLDALKGLQQPVCAATPTPGLDKMYEEMLARYMKLEEKVVAEFQADS